MPTAVGVDTITSIARRYIMPEITDNIYSRNIILYRLLKANKKMQQGGYQIEVPLMFKRFGNGGSYSGYDLLDVSPNDTVKNAVYGWAQYYVPVTVDGLTLIKVDSPEAIANLLQMQFRQAEMEMAENLATGIFSAGTDPKGIVGFGAAIDDGTTAASYAGITRSSNTWWKAVLDSGTTTLTVAALNAAMMSATYGGNSPTLIVSRKEQYNRYYALAQQYQRFPANVGGSDEQLGSAGFTNLLFNNIPWVVDDHVQDGPNSSNSAIMMLDETFYDLWVSPRADFYLDDFRKPVNQDAMTSLMFFAGQIGFSNLRTQAILTAVAA